MNTRDFALLFAASLFVGTTGCGDDEPAETGSTGTTDTAPDTESSTTDVGTMGSTTNVDPDSSGTTMVDPPTGSDSSSETGDPPDPNFDPIILACPSPGKLPFETETSGWQNPAAETIANENSRYKEESSDILGNPGGVLAYTTMPEADSPAAELSIFEGRRRRTTNDQGLQGEPLSGENVSLWSYDGTSWSELGRTTTDDDGAYSFADLPLSANPQQAHYAILEADQSCSPHYTFALEPGTKVILTDIDGTMTLSDDEQGMQIADGMYDPLENGAAALLMQTWADKGYEIVYLTGRAHVLRADTRVWLREHGFPTGPLITAPTLAFGDAARSYKSTWVGRLRNDFGWEITAAYGNADSDIDAFDDGGIPKDVTFIIGENAGAADTQPIADNDFSDHITSYVEAQPDA